ncbi:MAG TPA: transcriptional regulator GcvA [Burkholderiales bacterium]|nr:transcriptional regulator GcvA [Burkholderiales bacterium]
MRMQREHRILPTLDFLKGFEAAARHLSFTKAARELFVTQSAVSRQIQSLEQQLGVVLFQRRPKDLVLTEAGETLYRTASEILRQVRDAMERLDASGRPEALTVTCTVAFASLWLIPRLTAFRQERPGADVRIAADNSLLDLERQRMDVAIRFCPPKLVPENATRLFGEEIFPVCAPALLRDRSRPLKRPEDLRHHVLLHLHEPGGPQPWANWVTWLEPLPDLTVETAGALRFNQYDQMIQAAVDGQGIALGRSPLVRRLIKQGKLVAPFSRRTVSPRAYYVFTSRGAAERPEVGEFVSWLLREAKRDEQPSGR